MEQTLPSNHRPKCDGDDNDVEVDSHSSSSSSDDDIGPRRGPPGTKILSNSYRVPSDSNRASQDLLDGQPWPAASTRELQRDEWMISLPDQGTLKSTTLRNRRFNPGRGPSCPSQTTGNMSPWTETPEQKKRRLENEVMGVQVPADADRRPPTAGMPKADRAMAKRMKIYNVSFQITDVDPNRQ
jgi:hypothetical protein